MPAAVSSIAALLSSVFVLIAGNGLTNTLVPLRAKIEGFPDLAIGLLGSGYFAGMLAGTLAAPILIARAGYIRAFAAFVAGAVVVSLIYPVAVQPAIWVGLRYAIGFLFSGFYAVIEAWLSDKSSDADRGRIYAVYQVVSYGATAVGQEILSFVEPRSAALFSIAAGLFALAMLPMAFTKAEPPPKPRTVSLRLPWLYVTAPVAAIGSFAIGCANGSFWAMVPVYGLSLGFGPGRVAGFITAVIIGTALALYPVGRLSDRADRRLVLTAFAAIGALAEVALAAGSALPYGIVCGLGFAVGATTMVLYTLAVSHANDRAGPLHAVTVSSGLLFLYCAGAIVAPVVASALMGRFGATALFWQNAFTHAALACFALWRIGLRRRGPALRRTPSLGEIEPGRG
jgi:MFS family permease